MWLLNSVMRVLLHPKRVCPKCGKEQSVDQEKKAQTINCRFCGAKIPPPQKSDQPSP